MSVWNLPCMRTPQISVVSSAGAWKLSLRVENSIKPKTVELARELDLFRYDIAVLCETWLKPNVPNRLLVFPGYTLNRSDRKFEPRGYGGVAVLSRDGIEVKKISAPASASGLSRLETLWCLFRWKRSKVVIGAVYRQPRNTCSALDADFEDLEWQYQHVILNYPDCAVAPKPEISPAEAFAWTSSEPPVLTPAGNNGNYEFDGVCPAAPPRGQAGPGSQVGRPIQPIRGAKFVPLDDTPPLAGPNDKRKLQLRILDIVPSDV
ncbi:hypothetical protein FJT64_025681 [Amphibalanus amphitrite]|uniref:Endonuclease/exonuclease/phosphatase domain-containing protein n=1 Tax=Amphibalanus amphitrite TaxID=1232801 RepID=A0A6A4W4H8_AMPAM|nr:hypothetical protein FJT64_025681 [Amphibalanus amphitrite]